MFHCYHSIGICDHGEKYSFFTDWVLSLVDTVTNFPIKISKLSCSFIYLQLVYLMTPSVTENMELYDVQATDIVAHISSGKCGKINTSASIVVIFICFVIHH